MRNPPVEGDDAEPRQAVEADEGDAFSLLYELVAPPTLRGAEELGQTVMGRGDPCRR